MSFMRATNAYSLSLCMCVERNTNLKLTKSNIVVRYLLVKKHNDEKKRPWPDSNRRSPVY